MFQVNNLKSEWDMGMSEVRYTQVTYIHASVNV